MRVRRPSIERWFIDLLRDEVRAEGFDVEVGNKEPDTLKLPLLRPLIVVRDDPGPRLDWTTFDHSVGFTVLDGSKQNDTRATEIAQLVASIVHDSDLVHRTDSPIAFVDFSGCIGPASVFDDLDVARKYLTGQYTVTGSW